jgi:plastocyanin
MRRRKEIMRTKKCFVVLSGIALIVALAFLLAAPTVSSSADCRVIRIYSSDAQGGLGDIRIEPSAMAVFKGTCIIWVNLGKGEAKVTFQEGKKCDDAAEAEAGFSMAETCFVTSWLATGATSSLTFQQEGLYEYEISWQGDKVTAKGRIVVQ